MTTAANTATKFKNEHRPTRIAVELVNGRARASTLDQGRFLGGRLMQTNGSHIRLALVGIHMPLLGGDSVKIDIQVGQDVTLEIIEPSGMVAYDADGQYSSWDLNAQVEEGGKLIWHGKEFIASNGSNAHRRTTIDLEADAQALIKETLVLGRSGESEAQLNTRTTAFLDGEELLVENLALTSSMRGLPGIIGSSKVVSTVFALGIRPNDEVSGAKRLDLAGLGAVWRSLALAAHTTEQKAGPVFEAWKNELFTFNN